DQEDCREEERLADEIQNERLRIPPQEDLSSVRRGRTCPEVQECHHDEQDATCNECSSTEAVGPLHFRRHGTSPAPTRASLFHHRDLVLRDACGSCRRTPGAV